MFIICSHFIHMLFIWLVYNINIRNKETTQQFRQRNKKERINDMTYNEFITGTECKDNDYNYKVFKDLEILYMNSDLSKSNIYEYGKKLVDNSKTEQEIEFEKFVKAEISEHRKQIRKYKEYVAQEKMYYAPSKDYIEYCKEMIKYHRTEIEKLKFLLPQ